MRSARIHVIWPDLVQAFALALNINTIKPGAACGGMAPQHAADVKCLRQIMTHVASKGQKKEAALEPHQHTICGQITTHTRPT